MSYHEQLKKQLYAHVAYPDALTAAVARAPIWRDFCQLPRETKMRFAYADHQQGVKDPGYKERERAKGREDKWYFHYTGQNQELLKAYDLVDFVSSTPALKAFFAFAGDVYAQARTLALEISKDLDVAVPGIFNEVTKGKDDMVLRLLCYTPCDANDMSLADPHIDRSGFTLHLYESHPGLELLGWDNQWRPAPMGNGHTIVFGGWQLQQKSGEGIAATWHRVRRIPTVNDVEPRTSMVFFIPLVDTPSYPKDDRFQSLVPGYVRQTA